MNQTARQDIAIRLSNWAMRVERYVGKGYLIPDELESVHKVTEALRALSGLMGRKNDHPLPHQTLRRHVSKLLRQRPLPHRPYVASSAG